jgi:hypothetical protein
MEIRLKEGEDLICEVSGAHEKALIKLQAGDKAETPWMGIEALRKAFKILAPLAGVEPEPPRQVITHVEHHHPQPVHQSSPQAMQTISAGIPKVSSMTPDMKANLKSFHDQLTDMIENPPPNANGEISDGVSEQHIRRLIGDHQGRFQDPIALYPILQGLMGMTRDRFQQIIEMNRKSNLVY